MKKSKLLKAAKLISRICAYQHMTCPYETGKNKDGAVRIEVHSPCKTCPLCLGETDYQYICPFFNREDEGCAPNEWVVSGWDESDTKSDDEIWETLQEISNICKDSCCDNCEMMYYGGGSCEIDTKPQYWTLNNLSAKTRTTKIYKVLMSIYWKCLYSENCLDCEYRVDGECLFDANLPEDWEVGRNDNVRSNK